MRNLLLKIGLRMGWVTSPSILFDLAMLGEKSTYYENTIRSIRKDVNGCKALFLCLFIVCRRKRIN